MWERARDSSAKEINVNTCPCPGVRNSTWYLTRSPENCLCSQRHSRERRDARVADCQPYSLRSFLWVIAPRGWGASIGLLWKLTLKVNYVTLFDAHFRLIFRKWSWWDKFGITCLTYNLLPIASRRQSTLGRQFPCRDAHLLSFTPINSFHVSTCICPAAPSLRAFCSKVCAAKADKN